MRAELIVQVAIGNLVALALLAVAAKAPRAARYMIGAGLLAAGGSVSSTAY